MCADGLSFRVFNRFPASTVFVTAFDQYALDAG